MIAASVLHFVDPILETSTLSKESIVKKTLILLAASAALVAHAQPLQTIGDGSTGTLQTIGDVDNSKSSSAATLINPSATSNGNNLSTAADIRTQISPDIKSDTSSNALGANLALGNNSTANASNGPQTMGQANTGNSAIGDTKATVGNLTTGPSTATTGPVTSTSAGGTGLGVGVGLGGEGGKGGAGGAASSNGTVTGTNGQQQGIDRSGNSANAVKGGDQTQATRQNTTAGNGAGAGAGSGNRTTLVSEGDRNSYESRAVAWAPVIHGPAAAPLAAGNVIVTPGKCGPRMMVVSRDVVGQRFKSILPDSTFVQTTTDRLVPLTDGNGKPLAPFEDRDGYLIGHEVYSYALNGQSSTAGSISLGIFGKNNDAGQGGSSSSGGVNQIIKEIELRDCVYAIAVVAPAAPVVIPPKDRTHGPAPKADRN